MMSIQGKQTLMFIMYLIHFSVKRSTIEKKRVKEHFSHNHKFHCRFFSCDMKISDGFPH